MTGVAGTQEIPQVIAEIQHYLDGLREREPQAAETVAEALLETIRELEAALAAAAETTARAGTTDPVAVASADWEAVDLDLADRLDDLVPDLEPAATADKFTMRAADLAQHRAVLRGAAGE